MRTFERPPTRRGAGWAAAGVALVALAGCAEPGEAPLELPAATGMFDRPQAVLATEAAIYVTNTAFDITTLSFGPGSVTVVEPDSGAALARWRTSQPNPQALAADDGGVWVLASGLTRFLPAEGAHVAEGPGALDWFARGAPDGATAERSLEIGVGGEDATAGGYGSMAVDPSRGWAWLGSGLSPRVLKVDLGGAAWLRGPEAPITPLPDARRRGLARNDTVVVRWHPAGFVIALSFSTNTLIRIDPDTDERIGDPVSLSATSQLEGPIDAAIAVGHEPDTWVLLALAHAVASWSSSGGEVDARALGTGASPNALLTTGDALWIVTSGENYLGRLPLGGGTVRRARLPAGSNPYAAHARGNALWVSLNLADGLAEIDTETAEVRRILR